MTNRLGKAAPHVLVATTLLLAACSKKTEEGSSFAPTSTKGEITVLAAAPGAPVDGRVFGTNVPAWLGGLVADETFIAKTRALGTPLLRLPGGSWSNGYEWLPCEQSTPDCEFSGPVRPSNFIDFIQATGTEAMWTISANATAQEAAALVAFFNGAVDDDTVIGPDRNGTDWKTVGDWAQLRSDNGNPDPQPIALWEVGNELYGGKAEIGGDCADWGWEDVWTCDGTEYVQGNSTNDGYLDVRAAMKAVDPSISVGAVGISKQDEWENWGNEVISSAGDQLDFYVVHHYGFNGEPDPKVTPGLPDNTWETIVNDVRSTVNTATPGRDVPIAVTEYNLVASQDNDVNRQMTRALNAFFIAETLGEFVEHDVAIANQWNLANGRPGNGTDYGMIDVNTGVRSPQYYSMALWTRFGLERFDIRTSDLDGSQLRVWAGRDAQGRYTLMLINSGSSDITRTIRIEGAGTPTSASADVITAASLDATEVKFNGSLDPSVDLATPAAGMMPIADGAVTATLPKLSITLLRITTD
jgi:alpha-L-arabinofuranosidase